MTISIIIPVRNEENSIGPCLDSLSGCRDLEILIVDGNSSDQTVHMAEQRGYRAIVSASGRGNQQHTGAGAASGEILLFLHCDTRLPHDFSCHVREILQQEGVAAGAFQLAVDTPARGYRIIEWGANLRSRLLQLPYGDQALFMKKNTYFAAGGFPKQAIMEDVVLLSRLKKQGRIIIAGAAATTSARRWQHNGLVRTTVTNQLMLAGWSFGISPERLATFYYRSGRK